MTKILRVITSIALIASLGFCGSGCSSKSSPAAHQKRGDQLFASGDYQKAEKEYLETLRGGVENGPLFLKLGTVYYEQGRISRAIGCFARASQLDPNNVDVKAKLALIYLAGGQFKQALESADFVLSHRPNDEDAPIILAEAIPPKEIDQIRKRLTQMLAAGETAAINVAIGTLALREKDLAAASAALDRAKILDPKSASAYSAIAVLCQMQTNNAGVEQALKTAAELSPLRSVRRIKFAQYEAQHGKLAEGRKIMSDLADKVPDYLPATMALAEIAANEQKFDECETYLKRIIARDPENYEALMLGGRLRLAQRQTDKAVGDFEVMSRIFPNAPPVFYQLAVAYLAQNEIGKATGALSKAVTLNPDYTEAALTLAQIRLRQGDLIAAITSLKQLIQKHPQVAQAYVNLAEAYKVQGNNDDAIAVYRQLSAIYPKSPESWLRLGLILREQSRVRDAREAFEKSIEVNPKYLPAVEQLVDMDIVSKQYSVALKRVEDELALDPKNPEPLLIEAKIYLAQQDNKSAEDVLDKAIALKPDFRAAYLTLARILVDAKEHDKALAKLDGVLQKNPKDVSALMLIGMIYGELKNHDAARATYEKLIAVDPKFSPALNNLAYLYSEHFNMLDKAYDMARRARELLPYDPLTADTLGWILYKRGEYPWALSLLRESANALPAENEVRAHLGMTLYMLREEKEALATLQRIALEKVPSLQDEIKQRLAVLAVDAKTAGPDDLAKLEKRLKDHSDDPVALEKVADIYLRDGKTDQAMQAFQTALKLNPKNVRALASMATLYAGKLNQPDKAMELAKTAYKISPDDAEVECVLGRLVFQSGDHKWSVSLLKESSRHTSNDPELLYDLALASYSIGEVADARDSAQQALQVKEPFPRAAEAKAFLQMLDLAANPERAAASIASLQSAAGASSNNVPALMAFATAQLQTGKHDDARTTLEKIINIYPDFTPAKRGLAILYAEQADKSKKAYEFATSARAAYPNDAAVAKALGIIVFWQGDYSRSSSLLNEASDSISNDADLLCYLGLTQFKLKQPESKATLSRAIAMNPSSSVAGEARNVLSSLK